MISQPIHLRPASRLLAFCLTCAALSTAGCAHNEFADEGVSPAQLLAINSFQNAWTAQLETQHGHITRLFVREDLLFALTDDGSSYVLNRANGNILHAETIKLGDQQLHPPVVMKDLIAYCTNASIEVYDRKSGDLIRTKRLGYSIRSDAVGNKGFVYFGADYQGGGRLVSVDLQSDLLDHSWTLMFPHALIQSTPAILGDVVYAAAQNGDIAAVNSQSREPIWPLPNGVFHTHGAIDADLGADSTGIYVASSDSTLTALNPNSGKVRWQYYAGYPLTEGPFVTKDMVFQYVPSVGIAALDKGPGLYNRPPKWVAPDLSKVLSEDEKFVYALRNDGQVLALNKQDGSAAFSVKRRDLTAFATNPRDGVIYAVTSGNRILAITSVQKPGVVGEVASAAANDPGSALAFAR